MWLTVHHLLGLITNATIINTPSRALRRYRRLGRLPEYRSIMVVDMAGSGRWPNQQQLRARAVLRTAIRDAMREAGITWADLAVEDRGDGMILLIPPKVSKVDLLDPVIPRLTEEIRAHNSTVPALSRIRLRVAIHAGEVHRDAQGWIGSDLITACRLVNGKPLYRQLHLRPRTTLVLVVSDLIYESVVRHHYRDINPTTYTRIRVAAKEIDTQAWLHTPGLPPAGRRLTGLVELLDRLRWWRRRVVVSGPVVRT